VLRCTSKRFESCVNCGTSRRPLKQNGYCRSCWRIKERMTLLEKSKWPSTQPSKYAEQNYGNVASEAGFDRRKCELFRQYKSELARLCSREYEWDRYADGYDIENELVYIYSLIDPRGTSPHDGKASWISLPSLSG
jgi:hypothetical protein